MTHLFLLFHFSQTGLSLLLLAFALFEQGLGHEDLVLGGDAPRNRPMEG